jgi:hypothetical protein
MTEFFSSYCFLKEFNVKYLLSMCVIGVVFSALVGCGESAEAKKYSFAKRSIRNVSKN